MDRGAWQSTVHRVTRAGQWLRDWAPRQRLVSRNGITKHTTEASQLVMVLRRLSQSSQESALMRFLPTVKNGYYILGDKGWRAQGVLVVKSRIRDLTPGAALKSLQALKKWYWTTLIKEINTNCGNSPQISVTWTQFSAPKPCRILGLESNTIISL